jgi:hypothetical protein
MLDIQKPRAWEAPLLIVCMLAAMFFAKLTQHYDAAMAEAEATEVTGSTSR